MIYALLLNWVAPTTYEDTTPLVVDKYLVEVDTDERVYQFDSQSTRITIYFETQDSVTVTVVTLDAQDRVSAPAVITTTPRPLGDINWDGVVNVADLGFLAQAFGSNDRPSDLNSDGVVNAEDLELLKINFFVESNL